MYSFLHETDQIKLSGLNDWLGKIRSTKEPSQRNVDRAERLANDPNWKDFNRRLLDPQFQMAVIENKDSDDRLKRYVISMAQLYKGDKVGRVKGKSGSYEVRQLADGRLGCTCLDWKYAKSHRGEDCKHITAWKKTHRSEGKNVRL